MAEALDAPEAPSVAVFDDVVDMAVLAEDVDVVFVAGGLG